MPVIFDTIHANINIDDKFIPFIDNVWMKRLKRIKQLGLLDSVFPSASHSRFEHSLGVFHLANNYINLLENKSEVQLFTIKEKQCVCLAGLFHDLGHGPFSHIFDNILAKYDNSDIIKKHEIRSQHIVEKIFKLVNPKEFNGYDIDLIKKIIDPPSDMIIYNNNKKSYHCEKPYLFEIINNKINNIDVDKFDYLERDSKHIGLDYSFNPSRIMNKSFICPNKKTIIYDSSIKSTIFDLFYTRYRFHKDICSHKTSKMCDIMLTDAIHKSEEYLNIEKYCSIDNGLLSDKFLELDDNIYHKLLYLQDPKYIESKNLVNNIENRKLYKCILIGESDKINSKGNNINKYNDFSYKISENINYTDKINLSFSFCNGNDNPLNNVLFYDKYSKCMDYGKLDNRLVPEQFIENITILYKKY